MKISSNFKKMSTMLVVAAFATTLHANGNRSQLVTADQPFVIFKSIKVGKYPYMFKCHPGTGQLDVIYFGTQKKSGPKMVKAARELENLIPIRYTIKTADNTPVQIDKKYSGYRESYVGIGLENAFKFVGLYPTTGYKGIPLVDEYKAGLPMKWALQSVEGFKSLKKYMLKEFDAANIVVAENKPLLLLEIADTQDQLDASDIAFLNQYFDLLDPKDPAVKKFFEKTQKIVDDLSDATKTAITVGEAPGEVIFSGVEKIVKDFDGRKIRDCLSVLAVLGVANFVLDNVKGGVKHKADGFVWTKVLGNDAAAFNKCDVAAWYSDFGKKVGIGCASAVAVFLAYNIIKDMMAEDDDADLATDDTSTEAPATEEVTA